MRLKIIAILSLVVYSRANLKWTNENETLRRSRQTQKWEIFDPENAEKSRIPVMSVFSSPPILAIHGYRQSDVIFSGKLGSLRKSFKKEIDFTFIKASHKVPPLENTEEKEEDDAEGYGWWFNTEDKFFKAIEPSNLSVGFEQSVALVEKTFKESGPFDGLIGFSQGASFVSILCAMQQKKLSPIKFDFAILISGFKSLCEPHAMFYKDIEIQLPTLHVYGEGDKIIPILMAQELTEVFSNKKEFIHEGGHYVPGKKVIYNDFILEMLSKKSDLKESSQ